MIDLHVHTTNSDGRLKVEGILERGKKQGIKIGRASCRERV